MFHFIISILLVLILSDFCFSCNDSDDDADPNDCFFKYLIENDPNNPNIYNSSENDPYVNYLIGNYSDNPYKYMVDDSDDNEDPTKYHNVSSYEYDNEYNLNENDQHVYYPNTQYIGNPYGYTNDDPSHKQEALNVGPFNNQEASIARKNCIDSIHRIFTKGDKSINYITKAIDLMILYGEHRYKYEEHVKMYYYALQFFVNVDSIKDTKTFTTKKKILKSEKKIVYEYNEKFHTEIQFFEDELIYDNILPNFSPTDLQQLDTLMGLPYNFFGVTTSSSESSIQDAKLTIFKNALFYHKSGNYGYKDKVNENTVKYFHKARSFGWMYMRHIKRAIKLITTKMDTPESFCEKLYPVQQIISN